METSNVLSVPEAVATGDKSQIASAILSADLGPLLAILLKVFCIIFFVIIAWVILDKILTAFKCELHIHKFTLGNKAGFGQREDKLGKEFIQILQKSIINMSEEIASIAQDQYAELSDETRAKIKNYINKVIAFYSSYISDESKDSLEKKEIYLMSSSLEYLKELMNLAAYDSDIINKTMEAIVQMMEQRRLGGPTSITEATKQSIIATITGSFAEQFNTHHYPFEDKIDHKSASEVIERIAKKQVTEIIEDLEAFYTNKNDVYKSKIHTIVKNYLAGIDGISMEDID